MTNIAILASYNGSGFDALYKSSLDINIVLVISNNSDAKALSRADSYNIDNFVVNSKTSPNPDKTIEELLIQYECEYLFLSGYMKKLSAVLTQQFKIINSHPALLPNYGGKGMFGSHIHEAVVNAKEPFSGVTIHEVNENFDEGKIILQEKISLVDGEDAQSLEKKIKELEAGTIVKGFELCLK